MVGWLGRLDSNSRADYKHLSYSSHVPILPIKPSPTPNPGTRQVHGLRTGAPDEAHSRAKPKAFAGARYLDYRGLRSMRPIARVTPLDSQRRTGRILLGGMPGWNRCFHADTESGRKEVPRMQNLTGGQAQRLGILQRCTQQALSSTRAIPDSAKTSQ